MEIRFIKLSPTRNVTILVEDSTLREQQPELAAKLLAFDSVGGEQVGFLEKPSDPAAQLRLQMAGDEFCGNGTMSAGALLAWRSGLADGASAEYHLEVSGAEGLVNCCIERRGSCYRGTVSMPLPERLETVMLETDAGAREFSAVMLPGIAHIIVPAEAGIAKAEIERRIRGWNETVRADALGVLIYDEAQGAMEPIVYVPSVDSAVWECGCGSGTAALGCWLATREGRTIQKSIVQPGGEISVEARLENGTIAGLTIAGTVKIVAAGTAYL